MNRWTEQQRVAIRGFISSVIIVLLLTLMFLLSGCTKHIDPPLFTYPNESLRNLSAQLHRVDVSGRLYIVANTHSMEPLILGGDWLVAAPTPYGSLRE